MEQYLRFRPLRATMNRIGVTVLVCCICTGWFVFLWGLGTPAVLAGLGFVGKSGLFLCIDCSNYLNNKNRIPRKIRSNCFRNFQSI